MNYGFANDTKLLIGENAIDNAAYELRHTGCKSPLIITDETCKRLGYLSVFNKIFTGEGLAPQAIFDKTPALADTDTCNKVYNLYNLRDCDGIIALGRESVLNVAKTVKMLLSDKVADVTAYRNMHIHSKSEKDIPMLAVPVIEACGSEATARCTVFDNVLNSVYKFDRQICEPALVALDDRMTDIIPPQTIALMGLHAVTLGVLAYMGSGSDKQEKEGGKASNIFVKLYAGTAVRNVTSMLKTTIDRNADKRRRLALMADLVTAGVAYAKVEENVTEELAIALSHIKHDKVRDLMITLLPAYVDECAACGKYDDTLAEVLLPLVGEEEYCMCAPVGRTKKAANAVRDFFESVAQFAGCNIALDDFKIDKEAYPAIVTAVCKESGGRHFDEDFVSGIIKNS